MKKFIFTFLIACVAFVGVSCNSCLQNNTKTIDVSEFVYDVTASAEGIGEFSWCATPHSGVMTLNGKFETTATNDTTTTKALTVTRREKAIYLQDALMSNDDLMVETAQMLQEKFSTTKISGNYQLHIKGYVKYGMMIFALDEYYPPVE